MRNKRDTRLLAILLSVALHAMALALAASFHSRFANRPEAPQAQERINYAAVVPPPPAPPRPAPDRQADPAHVVSRDVQGKPANTPHPPASQVAPPAPTAEEWAFAARYTLKNSKGYRYTWGQQVRSMMGTAIEGPDQGLVRFRVEIAPDGTLARLETLWTTSVAAEQRARKSIAQLPRLPPTPTGRPLIFEKTISFTPFASDGPPTYKDDCLPDPPAFRNPFAWDGRSPQVQAEPRPAEKPDAQALEECLRQLPQDTIEAESAHDQRLLDQWGSSRQGR